MPVPSSQTEGSTYTTANWTAESNQTNAFFGCWVAPAGDVDRDGYADVLVGAYAYDSGQADEGKTFAWYGGPGGLGSSGTPANADWSAEGNQAGARFGLAAGTAGDVNHDQYDDVIVGADRYDNGHYDEGKAFAYLSSGVPPATVRKYYYFNGQRIAMRLNGVLYYLVGDHLGTTSLVLNAQGNVVSEARHYPYGEERWHTSTLQTDYRFTGQAYDSYIKLYAMGARQYDPSLGRWISPDTIIPDPANPQSLNRYSYVRGNPLKFTDPTGHIEDGDCGPNGEDCVDVSVLWDQWCLQWVGDPQAAEQAFLLFLSDPQYFIALYADAAAWSASEEAANFEIFLEYSVLHTTPGIFLESLLDPGAGAALYSAHLIPGAGDESSAGSLLAAGGLGFVSNPFGKKGGPAHQAGIAQAIADIESRGLDWVQEFWVNTPGGAKPFRFVDVAALDVAGNPVEFWQVGRVTKTGMPVAREMRAIGDILRRGGYKAPVTYLPYYGKYQR